MLTHQNIISAASACCKQLGDQSPTISDTMLSYLPMCYMLERSCQLATILGGGRIGFYSGNMKVLTNQNTALLSTNQNTIFITIDQLTIINE